MAVLQQDGRRVSMQCPKCRAIYTTEVVKCKLCGVDMNKTKIFGKPIDPRKPETRITRKEK